MHWHILPARQFLEHRAEWDHLNAASGHSPALLSDFVNALITSFARGDELLAFCRQADRTVAAGVFGRTRRGVWETFQPAQAPIGLWLQIPGLSVETPLKELLLKLPGSVLLAGLTQLDPDIVARPVETSSLRTLDYIRTARVTIASDFESYWQSRGKNLQQNIRKQRTRMQKEGVVATLDAIESPEGVAQAIADYGQLESAGWKGTEGTAVHPDNEQGRFYRQAFETVCATGNGCIYRYRFGETPVAMDMCIRSDDTLIILKTAYDESMKGYSPAMLMRHESFARLFSDGRTRRIEFYGRVMDWHLRLTEDVRTLYHTNLYRWGFLPGVLQTAKRWRGKGAEATAPCPPAADRAA